MNVIPHERWHDLLTSEVVALLDKLIDEHA